MSRQQNKDEDLDDATFLDRLSKDPRIIPGIEHFCDRWCEFCPLTSRCFTFAKYNLHHRDPDRDIHEKWWEAMVKAYDALSGAIRRDLEDPQFIESCGGPGEVAWLRKAVRPEKGTRNLARRYVKLANEWHRHFVQSPEIKLKQRDPVAIICLCIAFERIAWYQYMIQHKLMLAFPVPRFPDPQEQNSLQE